MARVEIAPLADFPEGTGLRVDIGEHRIAMFKIGDAVYALGDRCSHAEASLAEGELFDLAVECPRHGSEFDLTSGEPSSFPATRPVAVYDAEVSEGDVYLTLTPADPEEAR
jgi:3-phenylpropionate/trans-cinnamate dioxygenase ferredoxin subunit